MAKKYSRKMGNWKVTPPKLISGTRILCLVLSAHIIWITPFPNHWSDSETYEVCKVRNINAVWLLSNRYRQLVISQLLFINQINTGKYMGYQHPLYAREELPGSKAISVRKTALLAIKNQGTEQENRNPVDFLWNTYGKRHINDWQNQKQIEGNRIVWL